MNDVTCADIFQAVLGDKRLVIFDIGARGGLHPRWNRFHSVIDVVGFEPDQAECKSLNESTQQLPYKVRFLPYALARRAERDVKFYICRQPGCSSMYEPNTEFIRDFAFAPAMSVERTTTLDTVALTEVSAQERLQPDCIKIDVQGAELDILIGGKDLLPRTKLVELEVEFNPQYRGQPLFHDIDRFMREQGWILLGLRRDYWRRARGLDKSTAGSGGFLMHGDALYYNPQSLEAAVHNDEELVRLLIIMSAYRQNDFVLSLLRSPISEFSGLSSNNRVILERYLLHAPTIFCRFLSWISKGIDHKTKRRLVDELQLGNASDWHDPDFY